uniref:Tetraspanin n=1 Tax=Heterorhabditis bacteriophora TaxID=37862 RepID=A0A1I7XNM3_HETBA
MLETAAVITAYALHEDIRAGLANQLQMGLSRYNRSSGVQIAWDQTQQTLSCCGVANSTDWYTLGAVPNSCCVDETEGCAREMAPLHSSGCMERVEGMSITNSKLLYIRNSLYTFRLDLNQRCLGGWSIGSISRLPGYRCLLRMLLIEEHIEGFS